MRLLAGSNVETLHVRASRQLDAVLPLTAADADRAQILFRSLEAFFEPLGTCYVVAPDAEVAAVRAKVPHDRYMVLADSDVIPELRAFQRAARFRARLRLAGPPFHGWFVQQLVKLAIADRVQTSFYVTLDADVICVRPTRYEDLVVGGRAVVQTTPPNHPEWNDDAERVLALPRLGRQYAVTPALFSAEAVARLSRHLSGRVDPRLRRLASRLPGGVMREIVAGWHAFLLRNLPWTEYALYHTFLVRAGAFETYHLDAGPDAIYSNAVWMEDEFDDWDPAAPGTPDASFRFSIVQSATRIPPERVWAKVAPLLAERSSTKRATAAARLPSSAPRSLASAQ
jgi:hypothetical protein